MREKLFNIHMKALYMVMLWYLFSVLAPHRGFWDFFKECKLFINSKL